MTEPAADNQRNESLEKTPGSSGAEKEVTKLTLEEIVTMTGELEHLNELVMLHIEKSGGFSGTAAYFVQVTPILDRLECEIRSQVSCGMTPDGIKEIIHCWIGREIAAVSPRPE